MSYSTHQIELLERVLLLMKYDSRLTLTENVISEQLKPSISPEELKRSSKQQSEDNLRIAKKWGWNTNMGTPEEFLKNIGYPKFGKPPSEKKSTDYSKPIQTSVTMPSDRLGRKTKEFTPLGAESSETQKANALRDKWRRANKEEYDFYVYNKRPPKYDISSDPSRSNFPSLSKDYITDPKEYVKKVEGFDKCVQWYESTGISQLPEETLESYVNVREFCYLNYKKDSTFFENIQEVVTDHDFLSTVSIVTGLLGMIPGPQSVVLNGIALAADLLDSYLYYKEGDPYSATIMAAFSIIPAGDLIKQMRNNPVIKELGEEGVKQLGKAALKKNAPKSVISKFNKVKNEFIKNSKVVYETTKKAIVKKLISGLGKKSSRFIINFIMAMKYILNIPISFSLQIGGVYYTADEVYLALYSDDPKMLKLRNDSRIQALVNWIKGNEDKVQEELIKAAEKQIEEADKKGQFENAVQIINKDSLQDANYIQMLADKYKKEIK